MGKIIAIRLAAAAVLAICGIVVLGISAHVETSVRNVQGISTSVYTFAAFLGAFTLFVELVLAAVRFWLPESKPAYLLSEVIVNGIVWIMWLAAAASITHETKDSRSICRNLNQLDNVPELDDFDPELLRIIKKAMKSACREMNAALAFAWIGFVTCTLLMVFLFVIGTRKHKRVGRSAWYQSLYHYDRPAADPFADPAGNARAFGVGVVTEEDPDAK